MKKDGFTLVELLAVIVIMGIIAVIIFPSVASYIEKSRNKSYNIQVDLLEKAAKKWVTDHSEELLKKDPYHLNNINLTITTLKQEKYLENNYITNPKTRKIMNGCVVATYNGNNNQYEFKYYDGNNEIKKKESQEEMYKLEIQGCDSYQGYIYTYNEEKEKTDGMTKSNGSSIALSEIFANTLIASKDSNLKNLGNEYFYQGLNAQNYVQIDGYDTIWRVLMINQDKTMKLVAPSNTVNSTLISSNPFHASSFEASTDIKTNLEAEINKINANIIKNEAIFSVGNITRLDQSNDAISSEERQETYVGKIGLITASEYLKTKSSSGQSYLSASATAWTMNFSNGKHIIINASGNLETSDINTDSKLVYPTIVIQANIVKKGGTGTSTDPYVISSLEQS